MIVHYIDCPLVSIGDKIYTAKTMHRAMSGMISIKLPTTQPQKQHVVLFGLKPVEYAIHMFVTRATHGIADK